MTVNTLIGVADPAVHGHTHLPYDEVHQSFVARLQSGIAADHRSALGSWSRRGQ